MTGMEAAGLWIALNAIFLIVISARVGQMRIRHKVSLGDGGNEEVQRAMRAQGNYTEYAPISLLALSVLALLGAAPMAIHLLGAFFLLGRILHFAGLGLGLSPRGRRLGAWMTALTLAASAIALIMVAVA